MRSVASAAAGLLLAGAGIAGAGVPASGGGLPAHASTSGTTGSASAGPAPKWSYTGDTGPAHWGDIGYPECSTGKKQSPINLRDATARPLPDPRFSYGRLTTDLVDNGHSVVASPAAGSAPSTVVLDKVTYPFAQFHYHAPSEHQLDGMLFPAEMHFVHETKSGKRAVVGVMLKGGGATNKAWKPFTDAVTKAAATRSSATVDLAALLPKDRRSFRYTGSLTTPPCSEGVSWTVFRKPVVLSDAQLTELMEAYSGNNRPVQPLLGRALVLDRTSGR